ncbi:hypothetical protein BerOc1_01379 [Pseudodesulfovibrio hydrargyri]|uniref:Uncharacterized protein n=1 Tax=Pseudodesulfovibrio hydrargyri TaxID=2125990 RepID=A0A1J5MS75_9BACT|nr:hypothetical protein [Pseudodesulfovibrio hydrargyri]OIQ49454.1 hypothetical protein BerOc1_01379 [Pseudodesulfovibrio hydrargyri]
MDERRQHIMLISRRLLIYSGIALGLTSLLFVGGLWFGRSVFITAVVFGCGIMGGFVSIQQRLGSIEDDELDILSKSWASVLIIPLFGGIFALVLYVIFLTGILDLPIFPKFYIPAFTNDRAVDLPAFLQRTSPVSGQDMAKVMFWSFVAGFSERFVPQVIRSVTSQTESVRGDASQAAARTRRKRPARRTVRPRRNMASGDQAGQ